MMAADLVACSRCGLDYAEDSPSVRYVHGDDEWRCVYEDECDNALFEQQQGRGHPDGF
jgi:hypothetical protein